jgi:hypothetical protein
MGENQSKQAPRPAANNTPAKDTFTAIAEDDPYNRNSAKRLLSGVKVAFGGSCPAAYKDDIVVQSSLDLNAGGGTRGSPTTLCSYYTDKPERRISLADHTNGSFKLSFTNAPADEKAWVTSVGNLNGGCNAPNGATTKQVHFAPLKWDSAKSGPIHSVFAAVNECPAFAQPLSPTINVNEGCGGPAYKVCKQTDKSVLDCCLGFAANCRADQKPQSTFCDNYMSEFCRREPTSPHCTCISPVPADKQNKFNITAGQECWYAPCADNIKGTDQAKRSYMTSMQTQKYTSKACPAINIVDCSQSNNTMLASGMNFIDANNQNCSITGDGGGGTVVGLKKPAGGLGKLTPTQMRYLLFGGIGLFFVIFFVMILVLASS